MACAIPPAENDREPEFEDFTNRELSFDDYLATPETKRRHEVIDGFIAMSPSPTFRHHLLLGELAF
jgi:hypothetical protein